MGRTQQLCRLAALVLTFAGPCGHGAAAQDMRAPAPMPLALTSVIDSKDGSRGLRAEMDIAAPPAVVWAVLVDCATAPRHVPGMKSCKILSRDVSGLWDIREHRVRLPWIPLVLRNVVRSDYDPERRLHYQKADPGGQRLDGEWRLTPIKGGQATHVNYEGYVTAPWPIPEPLLRAYVIKGMEAVRAESLARLRPLTTVAARP